MANKSKAYITTFTYNCELAFNDKNGESTNILSDYIKYIIIDHDYINAIMPIIVIKTSLPPAIYKKMILQQGEGKVYLKIYRIRQKGSTSSAPKKVIYDEFDYYMTDAPNNEKELDEINAEANTSYKVCYIGLLKTSLQKKNKRTFEGIYKNTDVFSLVQSATKNMKIVIEPFDKNAKITSVICPMITSVGQFIAYLNDTYSFYSGSYIFYMDFDKAYLRSNDGYYIDAKDGDKKYIAFDIRDLTKFQSVATGMVEDDKQDAYIIYVSGKDANIVINRQTSELVGNVVAVYSATGDVLGSSKTNTKKITNISTSGATSVIVTADANKATNVTTQISEGVTTLTISKIDMDSRIFTPNKQYTLANYEDNPKYCGVYYMTSKKEIYLRNGNKMSCQLTLTLKKCADLSNE